MKLGIRFYLLIFFLTFIATVQAEFRTWTGINSNVVEAQLYDVGKDGITLKMRYRSGNFFYTKIHNLSPHDQRYVKKRMDELVEQIQAKKLQAEKKSTPPIVKQVASSHQQPQQIVNPVVGQRYPLGSDSTSRSTPATRSGITPTGGLRSTANATELLAWILAKGFIVPVVLFVAAMIYSFFTSEKKEPSDDQANSEKTE